jgi:hypothetical protein
MTTFKEADMFARDVSFHLKSNMLSDYTRTFDRTFFRYFASRTAFWSVFHKNGSLKGAASATPFRAVGMGGL